jgi:ankyrin repeat protein
MRRSSWLVVGMASLWPVLAAGAAGPETSLLEAVKQGDHDAVRSLVAKHVDINAREVDGTAALHWAVRAGDHDTVSLLLNTGASANVANRYGITPLWLAAVNGDTAMIATLLKAGADPDVALPSGETALLVAANTGKLEAVKALIAAGADVRAKENVFGQNALMLAAAENHADVCKTLIEAGADVNGQSPVFQMKSYALSQSYKGGFTPLLFAARQGSIDAGRVLLAAGAKVNQTEPDGISPLLLALFNGHYDFGALLIDHGADVNLADEAGRTPLYQAIDMRRLEFIAGRPSPAWTDTLDSLGMVKLLLARGADANVRLKKQQPNRKAASPSDSWLIEGTTPFLKAAKNGDVPVLRVLLEHGADPHAVASRVQTTAFMFAAGVGWRELSSIAPESDSLEAVKFLWGLGGYDINAVTFTTGQTALHGAASRGATSIIQFLFDHGARLDLKDKDGKTALEEAGPIADGREKHPARPDAQALLKKLTGAGDVAAVGHDAAAR